MQERTILLITLVIATESYAAFERMGQSSIQAAMGGSSVAITEDPSGVFVNPALIRTLPSRVVTLNIVPEQFGLRELSRGAFSYVEPTTYGSFALSAERFGFEFYREIEIGLAYGCRLSSQVSIGIAFNYYSVSIKNYGADWTLGVDVGGLVVLGEEVRWGFSAFNINGPAIGKQNEKLPQGYLTGMEYWPFDELVVAADIAKDIRFPAELHLGIQYTIFNLLSLRCGTSTEPSIVCVGAGIHYSFFQFDYAFSTHEVLGETNQFSVAVWP